MKYFDQTFWKFTVAFLAIILFVLVGTQLAANYNEKLQNSDMQAGQ